MQRLGSAIVTLVVLTSCLASSANAKSIAHNDGKPDYFEDVVDDLDQLEDLPLVGKFVEPYVDVAKNTIERLNKETKGNLAAIVNSVMPCSLSSSGIKCQGKLDVASMRALIKQILSDIPPKMLPPTVASIIRLATDMM